MHNSWPNLLLCCDTILAFSHPCHRAGNYSGLKTLPTPNKRAYGTISIYCTLNFTFYKIKKHHVWCSLNFTSILKAYNKAQVLVWVNTKTQREILFKLINLLVCVLLLQKKLIRKWQSTSNLLQANTTKIHFKMLPSGFFNALLFSTLGTDCWSAYKWVFVDIFRFDIVNKLVTVFM